MMVTCVEAYLQDLLSAAAKIDIDLMGNSEQVAKYGDVIAADSLDGLAGDLRSRWARNWVADGGPTRWIDRLRRMGAKKVPAHTAPALERLWGVRHVAVHNAGRATADFMKRHPGVVSSEGERVRVGNGDILAWVKLIGEFVDPIDSYFLARYPSLLGDQEGAGR